MNRFSVGQIIHYNPVPDSPGWEVLKVKTHEVQLRCLASGTETWYYTELLEDYS